MKELFLSQEAESPMAADLMASPDYGKAPRSTPGTREDIWNRLIRLAARKRREHLRAPILFGLSF